MTRRNGLPSYQAGSQRTSRGYRPQATSGWSQKRQAAGIELRHVGSDQMFRWRHTPCRGIRAAGIPAGKDIKRPRDTLFSCNSTPRRRDEGCAHTGREEHQAADRRAILLQFHGLPGHGGGRELRREGCRPAGFRRPGRGVTSCRDAARRPAGMDLRQQASETVISMTEPCRVLTAGGRPAGRTPAGGERPPLSGGYGGGRMWKQADAGRGGRQPAAKV